MNKYIQEPSTLEHFKTNLELLDIRDMPEPEEYREVVEAAMRKIRIKFHPDRHTDPIAKELAEDKVQTASTVEAILLDNALLYGKLITIPIVEEPVYDPASVRDGSGAGESYQQTYQDIFIDEDGTFYEYVEEDANPIASKPSLRDRLFNKSMRPAMPDFASRITRWFRDRISNPLHRAAISLYGIAAATIPAFLQGPGVSPALYAFIGVVTFASFILFLIGSNDRLEVWANNALAGDRSQRWFVQATVLVSFVALLLTNIFSAVSTNSMVLMVILLAIFGGFNYLVRRSALGWFLRNITLPLIVVSISAAVVFVFTSIAGFLKAIVGDE